MRGISVNPTGKNRFNWTNPARVHLPWRSHLDARATPAPPAQASIRATGAPLSASPLPIGRFGNSQVGSVEGPGLVNLSAGLSKSFAITERLRVRLKERLPTF